MGCTWCIPSRRCAPAPPATSTRPPRRPSSWGGPPPRCGPGPPPPLHPPSPPPMAPGHPPPGLGHQRPLPTPPLPPPPQQEGEGQGQGEGKGQQGALRQEGTEDPHVRAGTHRDRAPEETPHGGRKPPKNQEGGGAGTKARRTRAPPQTPRPTPRKGIPRRGGPAAPHPHRTPHDSRGRTPEDAPPKQASDAVRITPAHTHQPPETTRGMEGTPTRGERATPTEEAAENAAARRTTTPSPPGDDPGRHKGHLTGTGRGRRHVHSDQG